MFECKMNRLSNVRWIVCRKVEWNIVMFECNLDENYYEIIWLGFWISNRFLQKSLPKKLKNWKFARKIESKNESDIKENKKKIKLKQNKTKFKKRKKLKQNKKP